MQKKERVASNETAGQTLARESEERCDRGGEVTLGSKRGKGYKRDHAKAGQSVILSAGRAFVADEYDEGLSVAA